MHEAQLHERNAFVTLTYRDDQVPAGNSLRHRDWQLFAKRARKELGPFKFYMCGEYGEQFTRPHYHACLFGIDFEDKEPITKLASEAKLFHSATLERLWRHGYATVGAVTFQSAAYTARYVMKKITGDRAESHYTYIDEHGEIHQRQPEYNQMSRGGRRGKGIANEWFNRYAQDVYPEDHVIVRGHETKPPRYYDNLLGKSNPALLEKIKKKREQDVDRKDNTPRRLAAKEQVQQARIKSLKRTIS